MASAKELERHLCCPVCLETFRNPKILPCVHTFCQSCLDAHIQSSKTIDNQFFECPMCRVRTYPVNRHSPVCNWAQDFPSNHLVVSLLGDDAKSSVEKVDTSSRGAKSDMKCSPCSSQDKNEDASCFCVNCCEYLCAECFTHHSKFKLMRSHKILKDSEIPKDLSAFRNMSALTLCANHREREVEYKCLSHGDFICSACIKIGSHRKCEEIEDLATLSDRYNTSTLLEYMLSLQSLRSEVENILHRKINDLEGINRKTSLCVEQRQAIQTELRHLMDYYEKLPHKDIKETSDLEQAKLRTCISDCTSFTDSLSQGYELADVIMKHGSDKQAVVAIENLQRESEKIKHELTEYIQTGHGDSSEHFLPEEERDRLHALKTLIELRLEIGSIDHTEDDSFILHVGGVYVATEQSPDTARDRDECIDLGSDEYIGLSDIVGLFDETVNFSQRLIRNSPVENDLHEYSSGTEDGQLDIESETVSFMERGIRKVAEYDISVPLRRRNRCNHQNSAILSDGSMVFIDPDNDCLKVVRCSDFKVIDYEILDKKPFDLAVTSDDVIGVAVGRSVRLFRFDIAGLQIEKSFLTRDTVFSLCNVGENIGVLFTDEQDDTDETYIEIRNRNGKIMRSLDTFRNKSRREVDLYKPYTIRCRYPDEIIVCEPNRLKAFGLNGNMRWFYKHNGPDIHTIAFDDEKNIYICDQTAKAIHQVSASSFRNHRILIQNTGIRRPRCVLINSKARTLVVGFESNNLVQVYEFL